MTTDFPRYAHHACDAAILDDRPGDACEGCQNARATLLADASEDPQTAFAPTVKVGDDGMVPFDWFEDGVLWLVNATVFHPRGFALGRERDSGEFRILGDGSEPWTYPDSPEIDARMRAVERLFERLRKPPVDPATHFLHGGYFRVAERGLTGHPIRLERISDVKVIRGGEGITGYTCAQVEGVLPVGDVVGPGVA